MHCPLRLRGRTWECVLCQDEPCCALPTHYHREMSRDPQGSSTLQSMPRKLGKHLLGRLDPCRSSAMQLPKPDPPHSSPCLIMGSAKTCVGDLTCQSPRLTSKARLAIESATKRGQRTRGDGQITSNQEPPPPPLLLLLRTCARSLPLYHPPCQAANTRPPTRQQTPTHPPGRCLHPGPWQNS